MQIGIYGGAFDPPHVSHLMTVTYALAMGLDRVLVIPCWNHAFGKKMSPFKDRLAMTELAFEQFDHDRVFVSDMEQELQTQYTVDLIRALKGESSKGGSSQFEDPDWPAARRKTDWHLIIGEDEWQVRANWHEWDAIERMVNIFVVGRQGDESPCPIPTSQVKLPDVASSQIQHRLRKHQDVTPVVPARVLNYISGHKLYK